MSLRILITNNTLAGRAGTEVYVRDLAMALLDRGHTPIAFSTQLGEIAQELRAATVPVIDRFDALATSPDVIHGHHHLETMMALLHFPGVPAIYLCHGWAPWEEAPPKFPRILRYIAVDNTCRDRLLLEHAIPEGRIDVLHNFVDLKRFKPRSPLPERPRRALFFSNSVNEQDHLSSLREACSRSGLELHAVGSALGNSTNRPEQLLPKYDIVFAKGRAALEALAVGAAVILCDAAGLGPMVTTADMRKLRQLNFGIRNLQKFPDVESIAGELVRYDPRDAGNVSRWIRASAGIDKVVDQLLNGYQRVIDEGRQKSAHDPTEEIRATGIYLAQIKSRVKHFHQLSSEHAHLKGEYQKLQTELADVFNSATMRLRNRVVAMPWVGPGARSVARLLAGSVKKHQHSMSFSR